MTTSTVQQLKEHGFAIVPGVLDEKIVGRCRELIESARTSDCEESVSNAYDTYGLRNLTDVAPEIADVVKHAALATLVESVIGCGAFMVRSTLFDKTPGANWGVFWHQDLSIAVKNRCEVEGFRAWTQKAGVDCVQPPIETMQQVLAVRLHLDDCRADNGALKVLPGTHKLGRLATAAVDSQRTSSGEVVCEVPTGGALLMRPTLLHASSPMDRPVSRRVIHFEFANFALPEPLAWRYQIPCRPNACT